MGWHYQAKRFKTEHEEWVGIVEVFPDIDSDGDYPVHTEDEVKITGEIKNQLVHWLRIAADDIENREVIGEDNES
jgi:hypothetical protein